jgi:hypothetical protein
MDDDKESGHQFLIVAETHMEAAHNSAGKPATDWDTSITV